MNEPTLIQVALFVSVLVTALTYFASMALALVAHKALGGFGQGKLASRLVSAIIELQTWLAVSLVGLAMAYFFALAFRL